ncbi:uncharacterized protein VTP21DRAFT_3515 [Calcarisporiella thermophila]|uniref:uncharacterized protein n=1 Tax=Calcarisporiella thermophila TaxID=911321 RepID=UPI003742B266
MITRASPRIFITSADSPMGESLTRMLADMANSRPHLKVQVDAAVMLRDHSLHNINANVFVLNPVHNPNLSAMLEGVSKLCLVLDPLAPYLDRKTIIEHANSYIQAARKARVEHIVLLTPFAPNDPATPPTTPIEEPFPEVTFRSIFLQIEADLRMERNVTFLRYPGLQHQHFALLSRPLASGWIPRGTHTIQLHDRENVALAACVVLLCPRVRGPEFTITGPSLLTAEELVERVGALLGQRTERDVQFEAVVRGAIEHKETAEFLMELWSEGEARLTRDFEELTGEEGRSLQEYLETHRELFLGGDEVVLAPGPRMERVGIFCSMNA